jgi:hypothetical protein
MKHTTQPSERDLGEMKELLWELLTEFRSQTHEYRRKVDENGFDFNDFANWIRRINVTDQQLNR